MGAGIAALFAVRVSMGDTPLQDARLVVHGGKAPKHWKDKPQSARATADVAFLKATNPRQIMGIGVVRAIDIPLVATAGKTKTSRMPSLTR